MDRSCRLGHWDRQRECFLILILIFSSETKGGFVLFFYFFFKGQRRNERCRDWRSIWREQGQFFLRYFFHSGTCNASFLRAQGGAVNPAVTLGSNMYAGAHARSTFLTRHLSHKVSTSPHHDNEQAWGLAFLRKKANHPKARTTGGKNVTLSFLLCAAMGRDIMGAYSLQEREGKSYNKSHL